MGTWGPAPFDNDTACDWVYTLEETDDLSLIRYTLERALSRETDLFESGALEEAVAAADTVARLLGRFGVKNAYTESVDAWVEQHPQTPPAEVVGLARRALAQIMEALNAQGATAMSSDDILEWREEMSSLIERLA